MVNNRIDTLIELKFPGQLGQIRELIVEMSKDYDKTQFLEEDIEEALSQLIQKNIKTVLLS